MSIIVRNVTARRRASSCLQVAHLTTSLAVATTIAIVAWAWGNLSWKVTGSPAAARGLAFGLFVVVAALCYRGVTGKRSRALAYLAVVLAISLPTCGSCLTSASDCNPGGGSSFMFTNNTPDNGSAELTHLLIGGMLTGLSAIWLLRRAARTIVAERVPGLLVFSGTWMLAALAVIAWLCSRASLHVWLWLLPYACVGALLVLFGAALSKPRFQRALAALGVCVAVASVWLGVVWGRSPLARCERAGGGLVLHWRSIPVGGYHASGADLREVVCKTTFQYLDEETHLVFGITREDTQLYGTKLFARVTGSPLERANAARDLLFGDDCDELLLPQDTIASSPPWQGRIQLPIETDGKLVFYGLHHDYVYGRRTTVGMTVEPTRYEVDLRSFAASRERLR